MGIIASYSGQTTGNTPSTMLAGDSLVQFFVNGEIHPGTVQLHLNGKAYPDFRFTQRRFFEINLEDGDEFSVEFIGCTNAGFEARTFSQAFAVSSLPEVEVKSDIGNPLPVSATARNCVGRQTLSVTTGAVATLTPPAGAVAALIQADGSAVSITLEGTNPTANLGMRIDDGVLFYVDTNLANVKLIARQATTNVHVAYFDKV